MLSTLLLARHARRGLMNIKLRHLVAVTIAGVRQIKRNNYVVALPAVGANGQVDRI